MSICKLSVSVFNGRRRAFTLLEVLLAVAIFSICITALYQSFAISMQAFRRGRESAEAMQTTRFTLDLLTRDLRSAYFDLAYEKEIKDVKRKITRSLDALQIALEGGDELKIPGMTAPLSSGDSPDPMDLFMEQTNLRFKGSASELIFTRIVPTDGTSSKRQVGLERVRYFLDGSDLYRENSLAVKRFKFKPDLVDQIIQARELLLEARSDEGLYSPFLDPLGNFETLPEGVDKIYNLEIFDEVESEPPARELLAQHVQEFNLSYGMYRGEWQEMSSWDSQGRAARTESFDFLPEDEGFGEALQKYMARPTDALPSFVQIELVIGGMSRKKKSQAGRLFKSSTKILLPAAMETYLPDTLY